MKTVSLAAAQKDLASLIDEAAAGEEIVIAQGDKAVAKLVAVAEVQPPKRIVFGLLDGKMKVPADYDAPLPEDVQALFEGRE